MSAKKINQNKLVLYAITLFIALIIIVDFTLPGKTYTEEVISVEKKRQQYYNAARNYHYSYEVVTAKHNIMVTEDFAKSVENKLIKYSVSLIFNEINKYGLESSNESITYSFRIASGLVLPLLVIFTIFFMYKYNRKMNILIFVLQIVLLANFIMLIL
jgi:hypothetical protein